MPVAKKHRDRTTVVNSGQVTYYIRREVITVQYRSQYMSFNSFGLYNKKRFRLFTRAIKRNPEKYNTTSDAISLASKYGLIARVGFRPNDMQ